MSYKIFRVFPDGKKIDLGFKADSFSVMADLLPKTKQVKNSRNLILPA